MSNVYPMLIMDVSVSSGFEKNDAGDDARSSSQLTIQGRIHEHLLVLVNMSVL